MPQFLQRILTGKADDPGIPGQDTREAAQQEAESSEIKALQQQLLLVADPGLFKMGPRGRRVGGLFEKINDHRIGFHGLPGDW